MNDRSQDVRAQFYQVLFHWMQKIEVTHLRQLEPDFVQFLLNGIAEEAFDISPQCIQFLEEHGNRMKEALIALGEEVDDVKKEEEKADEAQIVS